jgi:replication initiation and membrane attachment protein
MIGKLLPVDGYIVRLEQAMPANFLTSLTHLYQPLIGPQAIMLYQTLINEVEMQDYSNVQTHHTLMNYLMMPLDKIYYARLKLEGMSLLKTYKHEKEDMTIFTYDVKPPYEPREFFQDALCAPLLYHYLGEQKFNRLKERFTIDKPLLTGEDITAPFEEVFQTTPFEQLSQEPKQEEVEEGPEMEDNFIWLEQSLKQRMIPVPRILTKDNRKLITQMMKLYDLDSTDIDRALLFSINEDNYLDREEFRFACHDIYKVKSDHQTIKLIPKVEMQQTEKEKQKTDEPLSKKEILIQELETISPKQLLEDLAEGNAAPEQDLKLVSDVMTKQGLPSPVMNVLIHYVTLQTNNKLSRNYLEKIAGQWSRAKLKTAKEAMEFAKTERANYEEAKQKRKGNYQKGPIKDIIPDWYKQGKHKEKPKDVKDNKTMSEQQRKVADLLKQYSDGN